MNLQAKHIFIGMVSKANATRTRPIQICVCIIFSVVIETLISLFLENLNFTILISEKRKKLKEISHCSVVTIKDRIDRLVLSKEK